MTTGKSAFRGKQDRPAVSDENPVAALRSDDQKTKGLSQNADVLSRGAMPVQSPTGILWLTGSVVDSADPVASAILAEGHNLKGTPLASILGASTRKSVREQLMTFVTDPPAEERIRYFEINIRLRDETQLPALLTVVRINGSTTNSSTLLMLNLQQTIPAQAFQDHHHLRSWLRLYQLATFADISASLIHELGQSLTAVMGASDVAIEAVGDLQLPSTSPLPASLQLLSSSLDKTRQSVDRIWKFARGQAAIPAVVPCDAWLRNQLNLINPIFNHNAARLEIERPEQLPDLFVDAGLLDIAVTRLLTDSAIAVAALRTGDRRVLLSIKANDTDGQLELKITYRVNAGWRPPLPDEFELWPSAPITPEETSVWLCRSIMQCMGGSLQFHHHQESKLFEVLVTVPSRPLSKTS